MRLSRGLLRGPRRPLGNVKREFRIVQVSGVREDGGARCSQRSRIQTRYDPRPVVYCAIGIRASLRMRLNTTRGASSMVSLVLFSPSWTVSM